MISAASTRRRQSAGLDHAQRSRRVLGVIRSEAEVQPARFLAEAVVDRTQEGVHVVVHLALVLLDVLELKASVGGNFGSIAGRDYTHVSPGLHRGDLDLEPG